MAGTLDRWTKNRPTPPVEKEALYIEVQPALKASLRRLAEPPHQNRSLLAESIVALHASVNAEASKEGPGPIEEGE